MEHRTELNWRVSSFSANGGECVEVASDGQGVLVRDSKQGGRGLVLAFTAGQWRTFIAGVRVGEFDAADV